MTGAGPYVMAIVGTATEVGKTWVGAALAEELASSGITVAAHKPAQSFDEGTPESETDAGLLSAATGQLAHEVCPAHRWYAVAMAPPMAAEVLGEPPFTVADLAAEIDWPASAEVAIVEGAGGVRSPLAIDGDVIDLITAIEPDLVVLVADALLGTLNSTRLSIDALSTAASEVVVHVNRFDHGDDLAVRNLTWLRDRWGLTVTTEITELADLIGSRRRPG